MNANPARDADDDLDEPLAPAPTAIALRRPDVPISLDELAARKSEAIEIIDARARVLETLRKAAIGATSPEDWLLFKSPDEQGGQVIAYLQDCGADRVRDLYGIEIFDVSRPERVTTADPAIFHYLITGSGRCKLTGQVLENVEGGRSSTDDFCRGKTGVDLELSVRKAARANLDGGITRELAGLKSVPVAELEAVWAGSRKDVKGCRRGRGFGTRDERLGGGERPDQDLHPPPCGVCRKPMDLRKGSKGFFYSCPDYKAHGRDGRTVDLEEWKKNPASRKGTAPDAAEPPPPNGTTTRRPPPPPAERVARDLRDDEVFGNRRDREPGEEG